MIYKLNKILIGFQFYISSAYTSEKIEVEVTPPSDVPVQNGSAVGAEEVSFFHSCFSPVVIYALGLILCYHRIITV